MNIKVFGLGGIGSAFLEFAGRYLNHSGFSGTLTLIDGKEYKGRNAERQFFHQLGNKAFSKKGEILQRFRNLKVEAISEYVTQQNVSKLVQEGDLVFICVDNHITRKLISDYAGILQDVIVVSGGNDWIDGNVQIFAKEGGVKVRPSLTDYHPEIEVPDDRSPDTMSCEELAQSEPQLFFANLSAALIMSWVLYGILEFKKVPQESEVYFDITQFSINAVQRAVP